MAENVKRRSYDPYRNVSYTYDGSAARVLEGEEAVRSRPRVTPRQKELTRPRVETRPAGKVAPLAVLGFAAVAVMAVLVLLSCVTLTTVSGEVVELSSQMAQLKDEEATLLARYELAYDLGAIESAVTADGSMGRPQAGQIIHVDLTEPDSVVLYNQDPSPRMGPLEQLEETVGNVLAYFHGDGA